MAKLGIEHADEKSALVKFNRSEPESSERFIFVPSEWLRIWRRRYRARCRLGFDFCWHQSRRNPNHRVVKRSSNAKELRDSVAALKDWLKKSRNLPLPEIIVTLKRKRQGCWNDCGVIANSEQIWNDVWFAKLLVHKGLNRRSPRNSFTVASVVAA